MLKLREECNDAIVFYMLSFVCCHTPNKRYQFVSCMIIREPMSLLKPLYRDCVHMASYVGNGTHSECAWSINRFLE